MRRLQVNSQLKEDHSTWSSYGLGLQDVDGAVKKDSIDLSISLAQVDFAVDFSLHRKIDDDLTKDLPVLPDIELSANSRTCMHLFGYCARKPHHGMSHAFAQSFEKLTTERKLPAGTLVSIKPVSGASRASNDPLPEEFFILGVLCKRPLAQVFMKAWMVESERDSGSKVFSLVDDMTGFPACLTSHQAFYNLIETCRGDVQGFAVSILSTTFASKHWGLHQFRISTIGAPRTVVISKSTVQPKKQVSLPFGLKMPVRKRIQKKRHQKPEAERVKHAPKHFAKSASHLVCSSGSEGSESEEETSETETGEFDSDNHDAPCDGGNTEAASPEPVPPTDTARLEAKELKSVILDHQEDCVRMANTAETAIARSSYFHKQIGFESASLAATARSRCYHCSNYIPKNTLRFAYFFSTKRPSRYMHGSCIVPFVQADSAARKEQAVSVVQNSAENFADQSIKDEIANILDELLRS